MKTVFEILVWIYFFPLGLTVIIMAPDSFSRLESEGFWSGLKSLLICFVPAVNLVIGYAGLVLVLTVVFLAVVSGVALTICGFYLMAKYLGKIARETFQEKLRW